MLRFATLYPPHLCYNRLPAMADTVFDFHEEGLNAPQHTHPRKLPACAGDIVFAKTDVLDQPIVVDFINALRAPIILVTGVSDMSPTKAQFDHIVSNPNIAMWVGTNLIYMHPKLVKVPIGVAEPGKPNSIHHELIRLHAERIPWANKYDGYCVPHHTKTHHVNDQGLVPIINPNHAFQYEARGGTAMLPKMAFYDYMKTISSYKFVVCMPGFGVDSHRVSETLLMGSVPILLRNTGLDDMYSQFPCVFANSFDDIDVSGFTLDEAKYQQFLNVFWLKPAFYQRIFDTSAALRSCSTI